MQNMKDLIKRLFLNDKLILTIIIINSIAIFLQESTLELKYRLSVFASTGLKAGTAWTSR